MVIFYSALAMLCKTAIDIIGSRCMKNTNKHGLHKYYLIQSITIFAVLLLLSAIGANPIKLTQSSIIFGLLTGIFSYISYLLFLYSLTQKESSINVTLYRLNFIISGILGILLLKESITNGKILGTVFCLAAIFSFINPKDFKLKNIDIYFTCSLLAGILIGFANVINKIALDMDIPTGTLLFTRYSTVLLIVTANYITHIPHNRLRFFE